VVDASKGGNSSSKVVRILCANRRLCLAVTNGQLVAVQVDHQDVNTHFILHEAGSVDEVDPVWVATSVASANATPWDEPTVSSTPTCDAAEEKPLVVDDNFIGWEGMTASLMEDVKAAMSGATPTPPTPPRKPQASFLLDVTVPDGQVMKPGESFAKAWRIRNDSDFPFPSGVRLVHVSGALMSDVTEVPVNNHNTIFPYEEFDVSVPMVAPVNPGKYGSYWRLEVNGERFGHQLWVEIVVKESAEDLMKAAQAEADKIQLSIEQAKKEALAKAAQEAELQKKLQIEEEKRAEEAAKQQLEQERVNAEKLAAALKAENDRLEADAVAEAALAAEMERAEKERVEVEKAAFIKAMDEQRAQEAKLASIVSQVAASEEESTSDPNQQDFEGSECGNSIDWEHVNKEGVNDGDETESMGSEQLYASDLSASVEGAALAGAALAETESEPSTENMTSSGNLSESLVAQVAQIEARSFSDSMGEWGPAVTRLLEMGFDDVPTLVATCKKHATPDNFENHIEAIVNDLLTAMPSAN
jgi:hypothetical protein